MKKVICFIIATIMLFSLNAVALGETAKVLALKGPTGAGMVMLTDEQYQDLWTVEFVASAEEAKAAFISGSADFVSVPTNLSAALYNKLEGEGVRLVAINTLGVLHILEKGENINSVMDLAGKTLYATGQGSTPEYVLNYILNSAGIADQVNVEYIADHDTLASMAAADQVDLVMLPEPKVTTVLMNNTAFRRALDVTELFDVAAANNGEKAVLSMGCVIARQSFLDNNQETVKAFLEAYAASVEAVNSDLDNAAVKIEENGIIPKAAIAKKALPNCHIVFITGEDMKEQIKPFFQVLYDADAKSIGGKMPEDDIYFIPEN